MANAPFFVHTLERLKKLAAEQGENTIRVTERANWMEHTRVI